MIFLVNFENSLEPFLSTPSIIFTEYSRSTRSEVHLISEMIETHIRITIKLLTLSVGLEEKKSKERNKKLIICDKIIVKYKDAFR